MPAIDPCKPNFACAICGYIAGKHRGEGNKIERVTFLPCGHAFGHDCLFHWLGGDGNVKQCPSCAIPLRHICEHLTIPTKFAAKAFTDKEAVVLPRNYEFCQTPKGLRLQRTLGFASNQLRRSEARTKNHGKLSLVEFFHMIHKIRAQLVRLAENELAKEYTAWWSAQWSNFEVLA